MRLGFDVGGTKILGVATDERATPLAVLREPTPQGAEALVEALARLARDLNDATLASEATEAKGAKGASSEAASVGVGMAGLITLDGRVAVSPNLVGVDGAAVGDALSEKLGLPVTLDNDANCAARWESALGAARGVHSAVMVALGTGVGGALIAQGQVLRGAGGLAGEPGHMVVEANGRLCACGRRGCWEMYASGGALDRLAVEHLPGVGGEPARGPDVTAAARRGDPTALAVLDVLAGWLALGISNLCMLTDPEMVVIGGGLSEDWDLLAEPTQERLAELLVGRSSENLPSVVPSQAGELATALGAALAADPPAAH